VAGKCSVLQTGIVLVKDDGARSCWTIDASPETELFFTSLDFLKTVCKFDYRAYMERRLDVESSVLLFLRNVLSTRKPMIFHNAIYDVLHILKMISPRTFSFLANSKGLVIGDVEGAGARLGMVFYDTRVLYREHLDYWVHRAEVEKGVQILAPTSERLEELCCKLLSAGEVEGIDFHNAGGDALATTMLFQFFMRNSSISLQSLLNTIYSTDRTF
jgi:hypothetical protein